MKIVVVCENITQFEDYVAAAVLDKSVVPGRAVKHAVGKGIITLQTEDIEFIFCNNPYMLKGRSFRKHDQLVKVGSWYRIPNEYQTAIMDEFRVRKETCKL